MDEQNLPTPNTAVDSRDSFADLMRDHADLVYSAARRQLGNSAMAEDVMQAVFILLWRKAGTIKGSVAGWLVNATYFACRDARKLAARRQYHERAAAMMKLEHSDTGTEPGWEIYAKVLDEAMVRLRARDRDAVALRYLRGLSFKQVALAMGTGEDAAKKRVGRAVGRLRQMMSKKVVVPAAAILATQMEARCIEAAPPSLVTAMTASAGSKMKGTLAGAIAKMAERREFWTGAKIAAIMLIVVGMAAWPVHIVMDADSTSDQGIPTASAIDQPSDDQTHPIVLNIRAVIDGGDLLDITPTGAVWTHRSWQEPRAVVINGVPFNIHAASTLNMIGLGDADLSSAEVTERNGRGTVAMEKTDNGIAIHFADPQPGAARYGISIRFARKSAAPIAPTTILPTTLNSPAPIFLDMKATIAGSDVLTISSEGAKWRHVAAGWPSDVMVNDRPWEIRMQPIFDNPGLANADLSSAEVIDHSGRDTVVMEKTANGIVIYFADAPGGGSQYEIKIRFSHIK